MTKKSLNTPIPRIRLKVLTGSIDLFSINAHVYQPQTTQFQTPTAIIPHKQPIKTAKACAIPQLSNKQKKTLLNLTLLKTHVHKLTLQINRVIFELF